MDSPIFDAIERQIRRRIEADRADLVASFAQLFFSTASSEFLAVRSAEELAQTAIGAFEFLNASRRDRVNVQLFNPDVDTEGWYAPVTVIRTDLSERPFIVDTIREYLHSEGLAIDHYLYPVLHVERGPDGEILAVLPSSEGEARESIIHCEVPRVTDADTRARLSEGLESRLQDVVRATDDFSAMVEAVDETVELLRSTHADLPGTEAETREICTFLEWLRDGGFVFLGFRIYDVVGPDGQDGSTAADHDRGVVVRPGSGLGILRNEAESNYAVPVAMASLSGNLRKLADAGPPLIISKTNAVSPVHRGARMDYVGVKSYDAQGRVAGERRFLGLFTSTAFAEEARNIPILREKLASILEAAGAREGTHDYKEIHTIFNSLPKEELFLSDADQIGADVEVVLRSYHSHDVHVTIREDPLQRGVSLMVIMPKDRFSGDVRRQVEEAFVESLEGEVLNYHLALGSGDQARLHFFIAGSRERLSSLDPAPLEAIVGRIIRSWEDMIEEALGRVRPPDEARRLARAYSDAFSGEYQAATAPGEAVRDILEIEAMRADDRPVAISFGEEEEAEDDAGDEGITSLKLYLRGERLVLSDFMPILEHCGLRVVAVSPFEVREVGGERTLIYVFAVQDGDGQPLQVEGRGRRVANAILQARAGQATSDRLNALVLSAGLSWRQVEVLRAYASYAFQVKVVPSRLSLARALNRYPQLARLLFDLFDRRLNPEHAIDAEHEGSLKELGESFAAGLADVTDLVDDRALRMLRALVEGTVRTNYFLGGAESPARTSGGVPYISFKFACREMETIARSRFLFEVWVRSPRMEGVHLRGARVARGGIRHSDRPDDFRTEVLGLATTQMVKNAVIVPAGSKGGFVTFRRFADRDVMAQEVKEQYQTLMRGMLDLTDNIVGGELVPAPGVRALDPLDPYLVVAADKGTAHLSDVANGVADDYSFWLADAFASGGSNGYDHKEFGITARGAWECVKRHFRETGKDIQAEPFTMAGIGDMSGDVFGNGVLLSRQTRLIAAFDHRHIFIDPTPDIEASYAERERLFALPRSSWADYDASVLSPGGMILPRGSKSIELTPGARIALGVPDDVDQLDGEGLIRVVLRAPVELLWSGGIGTYVKASSQSHVRVGDPSNDRVRIDATELRAKVIGEGGNLGFTQTARIEYAMAGGRINTDAIDNSGGVDLSDREVNLKILLNRGVEEGGMDLPQRNELLVEFGGSVADAVLQDNEDQSLAISLDSFRTREAPDAVRGLITWLEKTGQLDRQAAVLPSWEVLGERMEDGGGLTRPELCVLMPHAKLSYLSLILRSDLPDDPALQSYFTEYFPPRALAVCGEGQGAEHRLRREIIGSQLINRLVNLMGATFVHDLMDDTGHSAADIVRAWVVASRIASQREIVQRFRMEEERLGARVAYRWYLGLSRVLERTVRWLLANRTDEASTVDSIEHWRGGFEALAPSFPEVLTGEDRDVYDRLLGELERVGADETFAARMVSLRFLDQTLEILRISSEVDAPVDEAARAFYRVSEVLSVPWLKYSIGEAASDNRWELRASQALVADLIRAHHKITARLLRDGGDAGARNLTKKILATSSRDVVRYRSLLQELRHDSSVSLAAFSVAVRDVCSLADRVEKI
jgi:glutamate dehydrogenase